MFDLDGTLADTLDDIAAAANHALDSHGHAAHPTPAFRRLAGQGVRRLFEDAIGRDEPAAIEPLVDAFRERYAEVAYDRTGPYPGVPELLDELRRRDVTLAVLSNKPHAATVAMIDRLFSRWRFDAVRGARDGTPLKPDPAAAVAIARELDIPPADWVYVGDTAADMLTGKRAGFFTLGVTWGFRDEAELVEHDADAIVHAPADVLRYLAPFTNVHREPNPEA